MAKMRMLVPDGTINQIKNPSLRYDTTGWTAVGSTLTRTLERARFGFASGKVVTAGSALYEGIYYRINWLSGVSDAITGSVYVRGTGKVRIRLVDGNANTYTSDVKTITDDRWYRLEVSGRCSGNNDVRLYVETADTLPKAMTFYVDAAQVERKPYATTYCDGDQPGCIWNVYQHGSVSTRSPYTRAGGRWVELVGCDRDEKDLYATVVGGLGVAPLRNNTQEFAGIPGSFYQGYKVADRVITIAFHAKNAHRNNGNNSLRRLHDLRNMLFEIIRPDKTKGGEEFMLEYQDGDFPIYIRVRYDGGLEGEWDIRNGWYQSFPIRFVAVSPFIMEDNYESVALNFRERITVNYAMQRLDGVWTEMNGGMNSYISNFAIGKRGEVYAVGNFTRSNNSITAIDPQIYSNFVAFWDGTQWNRLGVGANALINDVAIAPNGDVYVTGAFTSIGGVACNYIAKWNGTTWSALGTGLNATGFAIAVSPNGDVYVGGSFITAGGVPARYCARWDGSSWHGLTAAGGFNGSVYAIAITPDGEIVYFGGNFDDEYGTTGNFDFNNVALYSVSVDTFFEVGDGFGDVVRKLVLADSGRLYACGDFSTSGADAILYIGYWNGAAWYSLGTGANDVVHNMDINKFGHVLASGEFTRIGSQDVRGVGFWNGSTWTNIDTEVNADVYAVRWGLDGDSIYISPNTTLADVASITTIEVTGTAEVSPVMYIVGPTTIRWIENQTTKKRVFADLDIMNGEEVEINFGTGEVKSAVRGNLAYAILPGSDLRSWTLIPGENRISVLMTDDVSATMRMYYSPLHWSADAMSDGGEF